MLNCNFVVTSKLDPSTYLADYCLKYMPEEQLNVAPKNSHKARGMIFGRESPKEATAISSIDSALHKLAQEVLTVPIPCGKAVLEQGTEASMEATLERS